MRVKNKKITVFLNVVLLFSILFSSLITPTKALAVSKPSGAGSWYTADPVFENGNLKVGSQIFSPASCPSGFNSSQDVCKACFLSSAPSNNLFQGRCAFDPTTVHKRAMFVSQSKLPDSSGGSYSWGIWVEYATSDVNSPSTSSATLFKFIGSGINTTVAGSWGGVVIGNPTEAPIEGPNLSTYKEPYIQGTFIDNNGKPVPFIKFKMVKLNADGSEGGSVPATSGDQNNPVDSTMTAPVPKADANGKFITATTSKGLENGTYKVSVDEIANEQYVRDFLKSVDNAKENLLCSLLGPGLGSVCLAWKGFEELPETIKDKITQGKLHIVGSATVTITGKSQIITVPLSVVEISEMDKALASAMKAMAGFIESSLRFFMGWNYNLLVTTPRYVLSAGVEGAWTKIRNVGLSLLVLALLIIAFANVLGIDLETYGLNRMIPRIILAIIFTFFSWIIVEFFFDFTNAIQTQAMGLIGGKFGLDSFGTGFTMGMPQTGEILGKMGVVLLFLALFFVILVCSIILWFSLLLRVVFLAFLMAVAPLAFIFNILPFTQTLYKRWWAEFWKWMFMGPVAIAIISLGYVVASGFGMGAGTVDYSSVESIAPSTNIMMGLLVFGASLVAAAALPMQWGGKIMGSWRKNGSTIWGKTGGAALAGMRKSAWDRTGGTLDRKYGAIFRKRNDLRHAREEQEGAVNRARVAASGPLGQRLVGATPDEAATLAEAAITGAQKKATEQAKLDPAALIAKRRGMSDDSFEARGIDRALLDTGKYNNLFIDPNDPNLAFAGANGVQISMYDKDTGGLVDAKNYSADTFGGGAQGAADYARFKAQHKTISDKAAIDGARAMAAQGKKDKTTRDLAVDKLAKGAAMSVKAGGASVRDQELYRDIESKQKGKKASEWNHDFVEHSQDSFVKGMSAQDITEAFSKGNPKVREALEKRLKEAKTVVGVAAGGGPAALDPNGNPITDISGAKMAELEAAYTAATGRVL